MADAPSLWLRPTMPALTAFIAALALLVGLGTWQLERRTWKRDLNASIAHRMAMAPLALGASITDPAAIDYRHVSVAGRLLHGRSLYLSSRPYRGRNGVHVITPLVRDGLPPVLVNRGWLPGTAKTQRTGDAGRVAGNVTVTGIARIAPEPRLFTPPNNPAKGFWMTYDPIAMGRAAGIGVPLAVVVEADLSANSGDRPKGGITKMNFANNHLQYALTWYALAIALIVVFVLYHRIGREGPP
ncbi:MAG: SURF1 family protein [Alphaproteobacteria bacterium]|nr:SURF1 family protein [Alphaproteobacteria bacterium]